MQRAGGAGFDRCCEHLGDGIDPMPVIQRHLDRPRRRPLVHCGWQRKSREVLDLFDGYVHGAIDRRGFLEQCAAQVGSMAVAGALLAALSPDFARAQVIPHDDRRITTTRVDIPFPQGSGTISVYVAKPAHIPRRRKPGVVLVVHENRGLNPHIEDIARRLAVDGFIAVAPDALTALGGYPGTEDDARALFAKLDQTKITADFLAAARWCLA